jgi:hypothetical protein
MNTYILFFGKSQDFTFYAFDHTGLIADFNAIIRNFDQLESNMFSVDDADNKDILAKYVFTTSKGKSYSLLKLYSCAQASNGSRISGSTFGVALLSEGDLLLTKFNIGLLQSAKNSFAKLALSGIKFIKSDFLDEAKKLWNGIIHSENGNYLKQVEVNPNIPKMYKSEVSAFHVANLSDAATELNGPSLQSNRVYITSDLDHLKRVHEKWGEVKFPLYVKKDSTYHQFADVTPGGKRMSSTEIKDLQSELAILKDDVMQLRRGYGKKLQESQSRLMNTTYVFSAIIVIAIFLTFYFNSQRSGDVKNLQDSIKSQNIKIQLLDVKIDSMPKEIELMQKKSRPTDSTSGKL